METAAVNQENIIHLSVGASEADMVNPYVPVRWCICPELLQTIKNFWKTETPMLLLVVTRGNKEVNRKIVPLQEEMDFLMFRTSGPHTIYATILFCKDGNVELMAANILKRQESFFSGTGLRDDFWRVSSFVNYQKGIGSINVEVDPAFFSKRPANWLWKWVNLFYETSPHDQCQFRRRSLLAFSIQPPVILGWIVLMVVVRSVIATTLRFGCGIKGVDFYPILMPLRAETKEIWCSSVNWTPIFSADANGKSRHWIFLTLMPVVALPLLFGIGLIMAIVSPELDYSALLMMAMGVYFGVFTFIACLEWVIGKIFPSAVGKMTKAERERFLEERKRQREQASMAQFVQWREQTFSSLVCTGTPRPADVQALPPERRTVYLRFMAFKARVCKPFSK